MDKIKLSSYLMMLGLLAIVMFFHMAPAALIGMLIFLLTKCLGDALCKHFSERWARAIAVFLILAALITAAISFSLFLSKMLGNEQNLAGLANKLSESVSDLRNDLPPTLLTYLPDNFLSLQGSLNDLIKEHTKELSIAGKQGLHTFAHILIATAIALLLSMHSFLEIGKVRPFAQAMRQRLILLGKAFENIVFAQVKISAINTILTAIFLLVILPSLGISLPYNKTLVIITFFAGLLPVIGNLISNAVITIISIGVSFKVAIMALLFLVAIHKLEYFINARIVGGKIKAATWELLLAFLLMEACFGVTGLLLAPIVYAYVKSELLQEQLI